MPALQFLKSLTKSADGGLAYDTGTIKVMLLSSAYVPNATTQDFRADVSANEVSGAGYTAGGLTVTSSVTLDAPNSRAVITFGGGVFSNATITARNALYYLSTGSAATDTLIANNQFTEDLGSSSGDYTIQSGSTVSIRAGDKIYVSCAFDIANGDIDFDTDSFKFVLLSNAYTPNLATHSKRSNLTNEVSGAGYTTGGVAITPVLAEVDGEQRTKITFPGVTLPNTTLSNVRYQVFFKSSGTASTDRLIGYVDFGSNQNPINANLSISQSVFSLNLVQP